MKIDNDITTSEAARLYRGNKPSAGNNGPSFADLLSQAVGGEASTQGTASTEASSGISSSPPITQTPVWQKTNGLVDALESYGTALGNPNLTLKQLEPLTNSLDQQAEELAGSLNQNNDDSLHGLAWQAVTQARVEVLKFRRGDYV